MPMPRDLGGSEGGEGFRMSEVPLHGHNPPEFQGLWVAGSGMSGPALPVHDASGPVRRKSGPVLQEHCASGPV